MRLNRIEYSDFRNLGGGFEPSAGVNLLVGGNGAGKTNAIEGIWLLSGQKSFAAVKDRQAVRHGAPKAEISAEFRESGRDYRARLTLAATRSAEINGVKTEKAARLAEIFHCVVFSPQHISLVSEGPENRRAFLDGAIYATRPALGATQREYDKVLFGRNRVLKELQYGYSGENADLLEAYTVRLAAVGARLTAARARYCTRLAEIAPRIYEPLSGGEELKITYRYSVSGEDYRAALYEALKRGTDEDIRNGFSGYGPHREDFDIDINGTAARLFASQGQKKSAALCLKLAEGEILAGAVGEKPICLLDDVMSELDKGRQNYLLANLGGNQIFISCCEPGILRRRLPADTRVFSVKDGAVHAAAVRRRGGGCTPT